MASYTLSPLAVAKIVMHACKYPHAAVNGVLLADRPPSTPASDASPPVSTSPSTAPVVITDCVPLFHTNLNLAPMLEAALMEIEATCKDSVIAGYYQANELLSEKSPDGVGSQIYHKIVDNCPLARCLYVLVDNLRIDRDCESAPLIYYQRKEGGGAGHRLEQLASSAVAIVNETDCLLRVARLLHNHKYRDLVDFDNHLDNISQDWTNSGLASEISG